MSPRTFSASVPALPASLLKTQSPDYTFSFGLSQPATALKGQLCPAPDSYSAAATDLQLAENEGNYRIGKFQNASNRHISLDLLSRHGIPTLALEYAFREDGKIMAGTAAIRAEIKLVAGFGPLLRSLELVWPSGFGAGSTGTTAVLSRGLNAKLFVPSDEGGIFEVPEGRVLINALKVSTDSDGTSRFSTRNRSITTVHCKDNQLTIDAARRGSDCQYGFSFGNEEGRRLFIQIANALSGSLYTRLAFSEDGIHFHGFSANGKTPASRLFLCNRVDDPNFGKLEYYRQ
ncbi:hypothetical protein [Oecophyllibacter saccharovorans]|uniref:hypothetical protein n=1 Tax=Oecophyllibacter saccharovorans TaxID=2558360 RepID=UPI0011678E09|nr:hypothetical protein [Oecophyllibacter saccharovorans]TPW35053.1 hypothetical protein E3203_06120 [Oecophyllibacter saccharovorans]